MFTIYTESDSNPPRYQGSLSSECDNQQTTLPTYIFFYQRMAELLQTGTISHLYITDSHLHYEL